METQTTTRVNVVNVRVNEGADQFRLEERRGYRFTQVVDYPRRKRHC